MTKTDQEIIDASLRQVQTLHKNVSSLWDGDTLATFYYSIISGTIARNGPEVAQALTAMLTEVYANTTKSHTDLGKLANGFSYGKPDQPAGTRMTE
ncbi:MAG: hypothetical protein JWR44_1046 [Hymenobacter sp.]|jgi:hypothetical protein|nr:hypothetical protein [Hymenobacter sp.]